MYQFLILKSIYNYKYFYVISEYDTFKLISQHATEFFVIGIQKLDFYSNLSQMHFEMQMSRAKLNLPFSALDLCELRITKQHHT